MTAGRTLAARARFFILQPLASGVTMRQSSLAVVCVFLVAIWAVPSTPAVAQQAPREKRPASGAAAPPGMFREVTFTSGPVATVGVVGLMPVGPKVDLAWAGPKLWSMRKPPGSSFKV